MKNKLIVFIKLVLMVVFALAWFLLIQAEYEMIMKPELRNECPIVQGIYAVYFLGLILLVLAVVIVLMVRSVNRVKK